MFKQFCCLELKFSAYFMACATTVCGLICFWIGTNNKDRTFFPEDDFYVKNMYYRLSIGVTLITSSFILMYGCFKIKPKLLFVYLVTSSTCFFILTVVFLIMAPLLLWIFAVLWYGQMCVNSFYRELVDSKADFEDSSVTFNGDITMIRV